jgi:hypothetical protein
VQWGKRKWVSLGSIPAPTTFALYHSMHRDYKVRSRLEFLFGHLYKKNAILTNDQKRMLIIEIIKVGYS